jgi:hypothetical protein
MNNSMRILKNKKAMLVTLNMVKLKTPAVTAKMNMHITADSLPENDNIRNDSADDARLQGRINVLRNNTHMFSPNK